MVRTRSGAQVKSFTFCEWRSHVTETTQEQAEERNISRDCQRVKLGQREIASERKSGACKGALQVGGSSGSQPTEEASQGEGQLVTKPSEAVEVATAPEGGEKRGRRVKLNGITRRVSPFNLFVQSETARLKSAQPSLSHRERSAACNTAWRKLVGEGRAKWEKLAEDETAKIQAAEPEDSAASGKVDEYAVTLDRSAGDEMGIDVDQRDGWTLLIENVNDGLVRQWNDDPGNQEKVNVGDRIVEVNSLRGHVLQLFDECKKQLVLNLRIRRPEQDTIARKRKSTGQNHVAMGRPLKSISKQCTEEENPELQLVSESQKPRPRKKRKTYFPGKTALQKKKGGDILPDTAEEIARRNQIWFADMTGRKKQKQKELIEAEDKAKVKLLSDDDSDDSDDSDPASSPEILSATF